VEKNKEVTISAVSCCFGDPGPGGWAALVTNGETELMLSASSRLTSSDQMAMTAVLEGLKSIAGPAKVTVATNSRYIIDGFCKGWVRAWEKSNWRTAKKGVIKHKELWEELLTHVNRHIITWKWVRGHHGAKGSIIASKEAKQRATEANNIKIG